MFQNKGWEEKLFTLSEVGEIAPEIELAPEMEIPVHLTNRSVRQ